MAKHEFGALAFTVKDRRLKLILVTTRRSKNWICPKGQPERGVHPARVAAQEAFEEAGVSGAIIKSQHCDCEVRRAGQPVRLRLFPLQVTKIHKQWPEKRQRRRRIVSVAKALTLIGDARLRRCVKALVTELKAVSA